MSEQPETKTPTKKYPSPSAIAKRLSEITPANTKEIIDETKEFLENCKLDLDGYRQVWKGIFFAMWASDKIPVQEKLAVELANLVFSVTNTKFEGVNLWFQACFSIMNKEWEKIDYWRVNKFSSMMRKVITGFVRFLRRKCFNHDYVRQFNKTIYNELYLEITQTVGGLALHVMQIYPEILSRFEWASQEQMCLLLDLFLKQLGPNACKNLRKKIKEDVFQRLAEMKAKDSKAIPQLNMNAYREKLFEIAKKKKTEDVSRKDLYDIIEYIDANINLAEEEARYQEFALQKEQNESKDLDSGEFEVREKKSKKKLVEQEDTNATEGGDKEKKLKLKKKKESQKDVQEEVETAPASKKKSKLNDASSKPVEAAAAAVVEKEEKQVLTKKEKIELKRKAKLERLAKEDEEVARLLKEEQEKEKKQQKKGDSEKQAKTNKNKKVEVPVQEEDDEEEDQDWEDEDDEDDDDVEAGDDDNEDDDENGDDLGEGDEDDDDDDDEEDDDDFDDEEMDEDDDDEDEEIDEEELNLLLKGTGSGLDVDDVDEDFYEDDDFEGYNVSDVMNTQARMNGLQKVYNSMPKYHFLSEPQKHKYFNSVTSRFKSNLSNELIKGCSHSKKVNFNKNGNKTKEFDLNEEVVALEKSPVLITKMKQNSKAL